MSPEQWMLQNIAIIQSEFVNHSGWSGFTKVNEDNGYL
jgi:hypothetical protein